MGTHLQIQQQDDERVRSREALYTIGYAGYSLDAFIGELAEAGIQVLVDVRAVPLSHKKGFSKNGLRTSLAAKGIEYLHVPVLGAPKELRNELVLTGDFQAFIHAYRRHLDQQKSTVADVRSIAAEAATCLLCVEPDPLTCHRSATATRVARSRTKSMRIVQLGHMHYLT